MYLTSTQNLYTIAIISLLLLMIWPNSTQAFERVFPVYQSYQDTTFITEPAKRQNFYAVLTGFPHNYEFTLSKETEILVEILLPGNAGSEEHNRSAIIVKKQVRAPVEEVARLNADDAEWETFYEMSGGDTYRRGGSFSAHLPAGEYLLEVHTVRNQGKYVLAVGTEDSFSIGNIPKTMADIHKVKQFFGKSSLMVLQSPYYMSVLIFAVLFWLYWRRRGRKNVVLQGDNGAN